MKGEKKVEPEVEVALAGRERDMQLGKQTHTKN